MAEKPDVTELLLQWSRGDTEALQRLMPLVHAELKRIARRHLHAERSDHTLQPTALVNEAYLRLIDQRHVEWRNRAHFFAIAARLMRRILVDYARRRIAEKRGAGTVKLPFDEEVQSRFSNVNLESLEDALSSLETLDPRQGRIVELRFFMGMTVDEIAEVLGVSKTTVKREWSIAKMWLRSQIVHRQAGIDAKPARLLPISTQDEPQ